MKTKFKVSVLNTKGGGSSLNRIDPFRYVQQCGNTLACLHYENLAQFS